MSYPGLGFLKDSDLGTAFGVPGICKSAACFSHCSKRSPTPHLGIINYTNVLSLLLQLLFKSREKKEGKKKDTNNLWIEAVVKVLAVATVMT